MEAFLAECNVFLGSSYPLAISVMLAGLVGSISHCSVMCSPMVAAQLFQLQENRQQSRLIWYYHAGRISTYMLLAAIAFYATRTLFGAQFSTISHLMIIAAGGLFILSALLPKQTHACCSHKMQRLSAWISRFVSGRTHIYIKGMLMGFMPCGMVTSVLLLAGGSSQLASALTLMLLFGLSTIPVLQSLGYALFSAARTQERKYRNLGRILIATNGCLLCSIGLGLINID